MQVGGGEGDRDAKPSRIAWPSIRFLAHPHSGDGVGRVTRLRLCLRGACGGLCGWRLRFYGLSFQPVSHIPFISIKSTLIQAPWFLPWTMESPN